MIKKYVAMSLCTSLAVMLLASCGGKYDSVSGKEGVASGSAVTGSAISEIVISGQAIENAVDNTISEEITKEEDERLEKDWYSNKTHLYYTKQKENSYDIQLIQRSLTDGTEIIYEPKELDKLFYVDDNWVYYSNNYWNLEEDHVNYICRVPIGQKEGKAQLLLEKEQEIINFSPYDRENVYFDGDNIVFIDEDEKLRHYKVSTDKFVNKDELENIGKCTFVYCRESQILMKCKEFFCVYEMDSGRIRKIPEQKLLGEGLGLIFNDTVYINDVKRNVWMHSLKNESASSMKKVISKGEITQIANTQKLWNQQGSDRSFTIEGMFATKQRLYIQVSFWWVEDNIQYVNNAMLYVNVNAEENGELNLDIALTDLMTNPKEYQQILEGDYEFADNLCHLSRGICVEMKEDNCYFVFYHPDEKKAMLAYYNLTTKEFKYISENDKEWWELYQGTSLGDVSQSQEWYYDLPGQKEIELKYLWWKYDR